MEAPVAPLPDLFRSLSDPTRLRLLRVLQQAELSVGELAQVLGLAQSGISRHLAVLRGANLVQDRREGTSSLYRLPDTPRDPRASGIWPLLSEWLAELPDADADRERLDRVLAAREPDLAEAYFRDVAPHWDSLRSAQYGEDLRNLALLELLPRELQVLDVGTGTGFMLVGVAQRVRRCIGVDRSEAMLEQARENLRAAGVAEPDLRQGSMESLPVESGSVDVTLCNMALHHAAEPRLALAETLRVLRPGGLLVLTDLDRHDLTWTREELADEWPGFAPRELARLLEAAGFGSVAVRRIGSCSLARSGARERHAVGVLLATARRPSTNETGARDRSDPQRTPERPVVRAKGRGKADCQR